MDVVTVFLESAVRATLPLALAALGEMITERAGVINIGLEGAMIAGALAATVAAVPQGTAIGYATATLAGAGVGAVIVVLVLGFRANQILVGTAVTGGALGVTAVVYRAAFGAGGAGLTVPTSPIVPVPFASELPVIGPALFSQPLPVYGLVAIAAVSWHFLYRTRAGLTLRAVGENPAAVLAAGRSPVRIQSMAIIAGSALGGLGGATLVLAQAGTFAEGMSAGRGFIALAVVAVGRWHPAGVVAAAFLFGGAGSLQYLLQATGSRVPYQFFLALPYLLTLVVLSSGGRQRSPAWLGRALP
jgi:simple sugar transport system permease protein